MEIWKDIIGYEGLYQCSEYSNFRRKNSLKILSVHLNKSGYYIVRLYKNGKGKSFIAHRITATAFIPNPENKETVNHIDGDKLNNHVSNLEWNTRSENIRHADKNGLRIMPKGDNHYSKKKEFIHYINKL